jgi:hypothetical protein
MSGQACMGGVTDSPPAPRACEECEREFTPRRRSNARLCGAACKQKAYRRRKSLSVTREHPVRLTFELRDWLHKEVSRRTHERIKAEDARQRAEDARLAAEWELAA